MLLLSGYTFALRDWFKIALTIAKSAWYSVISIFVILFQLYPWRWRYSYFCFITEIYTNISLVVYEPGRFGWIRYCSRYGRRRIPWLCRTRTWSRPVGRHGYRFSSPPSPGHDHYRSTFWNYQAPFCRPSADPGHGAARRPSARRKSHRRIPIRCPFYRPGASSRTPRRLWEKKSRSVVDLPIDDTIFDLFESKSYDFLYFFNYLKHF